MQDSVVTGGEITLSTHGLVPAHPGLDSRDGARRTGRRRPRAVALEQSLEPARGGGVGGDDIARGRRRDTRRTSRRSARGAYARSLGGRARGRSRFRGRFPREVLTHARLLQRRGGGAVRRLQADEIIEELLVHGSRRAGVRETPREPGAAARARE